MVDLVERFGSIMQNQLVGSATQEMAMVLFLGPLQFEGPWSLGEHHEPQYRWAVLPGF